MKKLVILFALCFGMAAFVSCGTNNDKLLDQYEQAMEKGDFLKILSLSEKLSKADLTEAQQQRMLEISLKNLGSEDSGKSDFWSDEDENSSTEEAVTDTDESSSDISTALDEAEKEYSSALKDAAKEYSDALDEAVGETSKALKDAQKEVQDAYGEAMKETEKAMKEALKGLF